MQTTTILKEEHRALRHVLQQLETLADDVRRRGRLDESAVARCLESLRRFDDGCHQTKEEHLLRRAAARALEAGAAAELARCACRHDGQARLLTAVGSELDLALAGDSMALDRFVNRARDYVGLQRRHAELEERELFPLLERLLAGADQDELLAGFERIERGFGRRRAPGPGQKGPLGRLPEPAPIG